MGDEGWILNVEIILRHLFRCQLTLVRDCLGGERVDVVVFIRGRTNVKRICLIDLKEFM